MNSKNRFSKPVAFNKTNPEDQLIMDHVKDLNFSGYVKDLILADLSKITDNNEPKKEIAKEVKKAAEKDHGVVAKKENGVTKITIV